MRIAFIHESRRLYTGAHQINDLISQALRNRGIKVRHFYPRTTLIDGPRHLKGINNILFFYSLIEHRDEILKCDIIQGTTYTPLAFIPFEIPVVSHFGSTTKGFIESVPRSNSLPSYLQKIWNNLKKSGVISELNIKTRKPLRDIADIEAFVASKSHAVIATSNNVAAELVSQKVRSDKIYIIPNAIENYWFGEKPEIQKPALVYLGRLGSDVFTLKLKGLDRLIYIYQQFKTIPKFSFIITTNQELITWLETKIPNHKVVANTLKHNLPKMLTSLSGGIALQFSRYEGFGLSLVEAMSCGLVPISFKVGIAPQLIEHGVNGFLVDNLNDMQRYVETLLVNASMRKNMAMAARETTKKFNAQKLASELVDIYTQIRK